MLIFCYLRWFLMITIMPYIYSTKLGPVIKKSEMDHHFYRAIILDNDMKVILISDPNATTSYASVGIPTGAMDDPKEIQGLSHFLEHMVFLGDNKYPVEDEFLKFLATNGGDSNAETHSDSTFFYFDIPSPSLQLALDRLSQFFIDPRFTESSLEREVKAVDSEYRIGLAYDDRREDRIEKLLSDPNTTYSNFHVGNIETLWNIPKANGHNLRESLLEFHRNHYSSNVMNLAVLGTQDLDKLQTMVEDIFMKVPNRNSVLKQLPKDPYTEKYRGIKIDIKSIKEKQIVELKFPIPFDATDHRTMAAAYVASLIGHEGAGSLLSHLKKQNFATKLTAGIHNPYRGFAVLNVKIVLTTKGMKYWNEVICNFFQYVNLLRELGPQQWYWEERKQIYELRFRYKDTNYNHEHIRMLTSNMMNFPIEDVLSVEYIFNIYNATLIRSITESLKPENSRITLISNNINGTKFRESYYGIKYNFDKLSEEEVEKWRNCKQNDEFAFPKRNQFVPQNFDIKPRIKTQISQQIDNIPTKLKESALSKIWFQQDNKFLTPKAIVNLAIKSPLAYADPTHSALNQLFIYLLLESLAENNYDAERLAFNYDIWKKANGIEISVNGFNDKIPLLLNNVMDAWINFTIDPKKFHHAKEHFIKIWTNEAKRDPCFEANRRLENLLKDKDWLPEDHLNVIHGITLPKLAHFAQEFITNLGFEWFFYGNLIPEECLEIAENIQNKFLEKGTKPTPEKQIVRIRAIELSKGSKLYKHNTKVHKTSCTQVYFQSGVTNPKSNVILSMLNWMAQPEAFNKLRTIEQLGYSVYTDIEIISIARGLKIAVKGDRHSPAFVEMRIEAFLHQLEEIIRNMSDEEFRKKSEAFAAVMKTRIGTMLLMNKRLWREITNEEHQFNRREIYLETLKTISKIDLLNFFETHISKNSEDRRKLSIHVIPEQVSKSVEIVKTAITQGTEIVNVDEWKLQCHIFPYKLSNGNESQFNVRIKEMKTFRTSQGNTSNVFSIILIYISCLLIFV